MTSNKLLKFLNNREYLHQISYQELKSLVVQYPYSLSLRYLLGMKSRQEDNQDLNRNKELLATYGIDRPHLFDLFNKVPEVLEDLDASILMQEDFLELKELSALERELDEKLLVPNSNDLTFIPEELAANIPLPTNNYPQNTIEEEETIEIREPLNSESESIEVVEQEVPEILNEETIIEKQPQIIKEEEIHEMDFVDGENIEDIHQEAASAVSQEEISTEGIREPLAENGLPADAVDVNDFAPSYSDNDLDQQKAIEELFEETEKEVIAEEAISDSHPYIENPEEVLANESRLAETIEQKEVVENIAQTEIPFEVFHSKVDPITSEIETSLEKETTLKEEIPIAEITANLPVNEVIESVVNIEDTFETPENISSDAPDVPADSPASEVVETVADIEAAPIPIEEPTALSESFEPDVPAENPASEIIETLADIQIPTQKTEARTPLSLENLAQVQEELHIEEIDEAVSPQITFEELNQIESILHPKKEVEPIKKQIKLKAPTPKPKKAFNSWSTQSGSFNTFSGINVLKIPLESDKTLHPNRKKKKKKKKIKGKFKKTVAFAEESLKMSEGIASETLAQLLLEQGHYKKAKAMFKQLCLIMPEKSAFFAGEIEKIQNLKEENS